MIEMDIKELDALIERCIDKANQMQRIIALARRQKKKLQRESRK